MLSVQTLQKALRQQVRLACAAPHHSDQRYEELHIYMPAVQHGSCGCAFHAHRHVTAADSLAMPQLCALTIANSWQDQTVTTSGAGIWGYLAERLMQQ